MAQSEKQAEELITRFTEHAGNPNKAGLLTNELSSSIFNKRKHTRLSFTDIYSELTFDLVSSKNRTDGE